MNVLITFYFLNNLGGIILNQEGLVAGLEALGHKVTTKLLVWKDAVGREINSKRRLVNETAAMGIPFDQELGWKWPISARFAYKGKRNLARWKDYASRFDLIIWQIPVPTMQRSNRGNTDWIELYNVDVPQVVFVHDGNLCDAYPWLYAVTDKLAGAVGVHPCAYHSLKHLPLPRAMAFSPQQHIKQRIQLADQSTEKRSGWFSLQTFKGWKHVDDLVRATYYMDNEEDKVLAGGGLHFYYMTSKDKVKPEYLANRKHDPDLPRRLEGVRIWELALDANMQYLGYLTTKERDAELLRSRFLIDPSWSKKYATIGDHFNRTIVDGIISGCVPIARNWGVATNVEGIGEFFKAGENYCMIPWDATPKEFAEAVDTFVSMRERHRREMLEAGRALLPDFDYRHTAQTFIDLAAGKRAGVYNRKSRGVEDPAVKAAGERAINTFFAGEAQRQAAE